MVLLLGIEPRTLCLEDRCSNPIELREHNTTLAFYQGSKCNRNQPPDRAFLHKRHNQSQAYHTLPYNQFEESLRDLILGLRYRR